MATFAEIDKASKQGIKSRRQQAVAPTELKPVAVASELRPRPQMAGEIQNWMASRYAGLLSSSDGSPIETLFKAAVSMLAHICRLEGDDTPKHLGAQEQIGPYRIDFALTAFGHTVIVELDGHEFHERTKEQAQRDKARDRYLVKAGYTVIHFTGSEVWTNPFACAQETFEIAQALAQRASA